MQKRVSLLASLIHRPRFRMILVGGFSLLASYGVFLSLLMLNVHYLIASVANFLTYMCLNFVLNKRWAFKSSGNTKKQAVAHFSLHVGNQFFIMVGLFVLVELVSLNAAWAQVCMQVLAALTVFIVTPIIFTDKTRLL